jgi:hypothetical protein
MVECWQENREPVGTGTSYYLPLRYRKQNPAFSLAKYRAPEAFVGLIVRNQWDACTPRARSASRVTDEGALDRARREKPLKRK